MAIGAMNTIVRNNRKLLRKVSLFKRSKSVSDRKKELLSLTGGELAFKKASQEELNTIKSKIRKEAKKVRFKNNSILVVVLLCVLTVSKLNTSYISESEKRQKLQSAALLNTKLTAKYNTYMEDANDQFGKEHWKNAVYFYNKALQMLPKDSIAKVRLHQSKENLKR